MSENTLLSQEITYETERVDSVIPGRKMLAQFGDSKNNNHIRRDKYNRLPNCNTSLNDLFNNSFLRKLKIKDTEEKIPVGSYAGFDAELPSYRQSYSKISSISSYLTVNAPP
jgi:hypothetical protein